MFCLQKDISTPEKVVLQAVFSNNTLENTSSTGEVVQSQTVRLEHVCYALPVFYELNCSINQMV